MMRIKRILVVKTILKVLWSTLESLLRNKGNPRRVKDAANVNPVGSGPRPSGSWIRVVLLYHMQVSCFEAILNRAPEYCTNIISVY